MVSDVNFYPFLCLANKCHRHGHENIDTKEKLEGHMAHTEQTENCFICQSLI